MLQLNDYCLEHICKQLDLEQQIVVKNVCVRLEYIVHSLWRLQCKQVVLNSVQCNRFKDAEFLDFMTTISNFVECLEIKALNVRQLHLLEKCLFPRVTQLDLGDLWNSNDGTNDEDTLLVGQLFPSLQKLTLQSTITGKYIDQLTHLIDLDLSGCEYLDAEYFEKIFTTLRLRSFSMLYYGYNTLLDERIDAITKCMTLEELTVDDHHLLLIINKLLQMPKIRKITCYTRDYDVYLLDKIATLKGMHVDTIVFNDLLWSKDKHIQNLLKMKNITKLIFNDDDFDEGQMLILSKSLCKLQEVCLTKCRLHNIEEVLCFVENCRQLMILDVSGNTAIDNDFVWRIIAALNKHMGRRTALELYCFNTSIDINSLMLSEDQSIVNLLKLNVKERKIKLPYSRCFQCIFTAEIGEKC